LPIPEWPEEEKPREALFARGAEALPVSALLAIILRTGRRGISAEELSRQLLHAFTGLRGIDTASLQEICAIRGIGRAKAAQLKACLEIGKRLSREDAARPVRIDRPRRAVDFVALHYGPYLRDSPVEVACLVLLNRRGIPIRAVELARGGERAVTAELGRILKEALQASAAAVILVHSHPSGDCTPSANDLAFTRAAREACALFGIRLVDHVIVGRNRADFYSLATGEKTKPSPRLAFVSGGTQALKRRIEGSPQVVRGKGLP